MKHALLALALAGLALPGRAQAPNAGPWTVVNTINVFSPPNIKITSMQAVSPTVCWALTDDAQPISPGHVLSPANAAGTEFNYFNITGSPGYLPASLSAASPALALCVQYVGSAPSSGEVLRTTDAGRTWQRVSGPTIFAAPSGFPDWVHMFDANVAVAFGDPNPLVATGSAGYFEIIRTTNASALVPAWTRVALPNLPRAGEEFGQLNGYTALGNTIWATTTQQPSSPVATSRVLRSLDQGQTWAGFATPLVEYITALAFKDQLNGLAFNRQLLPSGTTVVNLVRTTDGGQTWAPLPLPAGADTLRGKFYSTNLTAISGKGFMSMGQAEPGNARRSNFGVSFSPDGQRWFDLEKGGRTYNTAAFTSCPGSTDPRAFQGYLGGFTDATGAGGISQISPVTCALLPLGTARPAANLLALTVLPNPSTTGVFRVQLATNVTPGTQLTVFDGLGRVVLAHELTATATGTTSFGLDLHRERPGLYTLHVASPAGVATQKLLVE